MSRKPLPLGTWGKIRTYVTKTDDKGRPVGYRAMAKYRDFDGRTRPVSARGRTKSAAENNLRQSLKERSEIGRTGLLTAMHRFSEAAELWMAKFETMVNDGERSPNSLYTYRRHLENNVLPRLGDVRLGEATTPLIDKVVGSIKAEVGAPSARTCRSIVSGVMGLAVRYGAVDFNTAREVDRIEAPPKSAPRALTETERVLWFQQLNQDERAVRADLPDLTMFLLATGVRIAESLGVLWSQVSFERSEVEITHQVNRIAGQGLVRRSTKSSAGERTLKLPTWAVSMLRTRFMSGVRLDEPVFPDSLGGFRDPNNVRRDLRNARSPIGNATRRQLGDALRSARRKAGLTQDAVAARLGWSKNKLSLIEAARVRVSVELVSLLAETYRVNRSERPALLELAAIAAQVSDADTLVWVTSHNFRKTTATILDEAGHSARQVADQLGHSKPSMTQDVYMARKLANPAAAEALERALPDLRDD